VVASTAASTASAANSMPMIVWHIPPPRE
jgi:hypothetical protein